MIIGFANSLVAAPTEDVNAKIVLISDICCNPSQRIYFKVVPLEEYPNSTITILSITSVTPSNLTTVVLSENPDEFSIQAAGLKNYKIEGTIKVEFNNESIELPFQSALRLEGYSVSLNNTTTTYNSTSEVKTIAVTNPVLGLTYEWYDYDLTPYLNSATATPMANPYMIGGPGGIAVPRGPVATEISYEAPYNNGENLYVIGVTPNGCITSQVTSYKQLVVLPPPPPPFEVVTGKFTLTQNCEAENANFIRPTRKDGSSEGLTWKWISYPTTGSYDADPNKDLNLNKVKDGEAVVEVTDLENNQIETFLFRIWGTESKYWGSINSTTNVITWRNINLYGDLVVIKQFDVNDIKYAQKLSFFAQNYGYQYTKFKIGENTKVLVLSGNKAFNRLLFFNDNQIEIGKGVEITSGCNMWGGIVIHEKNSLAIKGTKEEPVAISNANHAVLLNYPNRPDPNYANWIGKQPFNGIDQTIRNPFNVVSGTSQAQIQINYVNFSNNYYHIYLAQELQMGSYTTNSKFTCNPDLMLPPYQPQIINGVLEKFMTEVCIFGYDGEKTLPLGGGATGFEESYHQGFFPDYRIENGELVYVGVNIANCEFSDALVGIRLPYQTYFGLPNTYRNLSLAAILVTGGRGYINEYEVSNQDIIVPNYQGYEEFVLYFKHQRTSLNKLWDEINGYKQFPNVNYIDTESQGLSTIQDSERSRVGLSLSYPEYFSFPSQTATADKWRTYGIITDNVVLPYGYFGGIRSMFFRGNHIRTESEPSNSSWNYKYGIYAGGVEELTTNKLENLDFGFEGNLGRFPTLISGNVFSNCLSGINLYNLVTIEGGAFKMSCNTFDFNQSNTTDQFKGITFSGFANISRITGSTDIANVDFDPSGNVWPVTTFTNRGTFPTDLDGEPVNVENASFGWNSPSNWTSITNDTRDNPILTAPQIRNPIVYHRFTNEFVGNVLPSNSPSLVKSPPDPELFAFTVAANGQLSGNQYVEVCSNELTGSTIKFPTSRISSGSTTINKNDLLINQVSETNIINIQVPKGTGNYNLIVTDILGRKLVSEQGIGSKNYTTIPLQKGVVIVTLETEGKLSTQKIIVK